MYLAIEQGKEAKADVIHVVARPCAWRANRDLRKLKPLPQEGHAINDKFHWTSPDEAFFAIVQQLKIRLR